MRETGTCVAVVLTLLHPPLPAAAAEYETVVTGAGAEPTEMEAEHMRRKELDAQGAHSVADALRGVPSVNVSSGLRGEHIFTMRGFEQRQTTVLVDGVPALVPYDGQVDLNMLPAAMVDRITVSPTPGSLALGAGGIGGVVAVTTRRPGLGPFLELRTEATPSGSAFVSGYHGHRVGRVGYSLFAGGEYTTGYPLSASFASTSLQPGGTRRNSDRHRYHAGVSARVALPWSNSLSTSVIYMDGNRGVPPSTIDATPRFWRFNAWRALLANVSHAHHGVVSTEETAYINLYDNLLDSYDDSSYGSQASARAFHTWYHDLSSGVRIRTVMRMDIPSGTRVVLRGWALGQFASHQEDNSSTRFSHVTATLTPEGELTVGDMATLLFSGQTDGEIPIDLPGEKSAAPLGVGPLASLRLSPTPRLWAAVTASRRNRIPSLKERFSRALGFRLANPDLRPEVAWQVDFHTVWRPTGAFRVMGSVFGAQVEDLVERVPLGNGVDQLRNVGRAQMLGAELRAVIRPWRWLDIHGGYAFLRARRVDKPASGDDLPYRPTHKAVAGTTLSAGKWLELSSDARVVGPQRYQDPNTLRWSTLGGYMVWDAEVTAVLTSWVRLMMRGTNLLDAAYQTEMGFPEPGRRIWFGISFGLQDPPDLEMVHE